MRLALLPALFAAAAVTCPTTAATEPSDTEEADLALYFSNPDVHAASLAPRPVPRAPATVVILTAHDLSRGDTLVEALARVPGLSLVDDGVLPDLGIRGVHTGAGAASRTLKVMIDGHPVSDRTTDASFLGPELVPLDAIERVEVIKGPMSALYGANAFLGVINIVTRSGEAAEGGKAGVYAWKGHGMLEGAGLGARGGLRSGPLEVFLSMSAGHDRRDGRQVPRSSPAWSGLSEAKRTSSREDDASHVVVHGRATLSDRERGRLSIDASVRAFDRADPFEDRFPLPASGTSRTSHVGGEVRLYGDAELSESVGVAGWISYARGRPGASNRLEIDVPTAFLRPLTRYDAMLGGAAIRVRTPELPALGRTELSLGVDGTVDALRLPGYHQVARSSADGVRAGDKTPLAPPQDVRLSNVGVLAEAALSPATDLDVIVGGRVDSHSVTGLHPTGRLGVVYALTEGLSVKALFGTSFLAPSPELLYRRSAAPGVLVGDPELTPQTGSSGEVAVQWRPFAGARVSLSGFVTRVEDLVVLRRRGLNLVATNATTLDLLGVEASVRVRRRWFGLRAGGAWLDSVRAPVPTSTEPLFAEAGPAPMAPALTASFGASVYLSGWGLALHVDGRWIGERPASDSNSLLREQAYRLSDQLVIDATAATDRWRPFGGAPVRLRVTVKDVLDEAPADPGYGGVDLPSLGRRAVLSLEQTF